MYSGTDAVLSLFLLREPLSYWLDISFISYRPAAIGDLGHLIGRGRAVQRDSGADCAGLLVLFDRIITSNEWAGPPAEVSETAP